MRVGIEIGGTFTDVVAITPDGIHTLKVSSTPSEPERGVFDALDQLSRSMSGQPGGNTGRYSIELAEVLVHGSTVATNALIERRGGCTALVSTVGFGDILELQREQKSRNYDLAYARTKPLVARENVVEARERLDARGNVVDALDEVALERDLDELFARFEPDAMAVCLLHAYQNPVHERRVRDIALRLRPDLNVSLSSEVMPEYREYERASTTVMNAYLAPVIDRYLGGLQNELTERGFKGRFFLMQSNGGMLPADRSRQHAVRMLVSGPAAGVTGSIRIAEASGFRNIITLDMGGTSTDICLVKDAAAQVITGKQIDRLPVLAPMLDITAIGAGGGSIAWFNGAGVIQVGPRSAGAQPGPACYGRGGTTATLTDACLIMGLIRPHRFLGGAMPLDVDAAYRAMQPIADRLGFDVPAAAEGLFRIATASMLQATRLVSIERGYDPRDFSIAAYGGAGPLHATVLAEEIGAKSVIVPPSPGVTSAIGLLLADFRLDYVRSRMLLMEESNLEAIHSILLELRSAAKVDIVSMAPPGTPQIEYSIDMRYVGQGYELSLVVSPFDENGNAHPNLLDEATQHFHALHNLRMGHSYPGQAVRAISYRARLTVPQPGVRSFAKVGKLRGKERRDEHGEIRWNAQSQPCVYVRRDSLAEGAEVKGAALIEDDSASTFIPPGWTARVDAQDTLIIERGE